MSSIINFIFPKLELNPLFQFQSVSDRITKVKSFEDLLVGLFYAYIEKLYELDDNISMRKLQTNFTMALEIFRYKRSTAEFFENNVPKFIKKTSEMMEELEKLCLCPSFLQKIERLNEMKSELREIFVLIPKIMIIRDILKMIKREKREKYANLLEKIKEEILENEASGSSFVEISEFLKMMFANTFQTTIHFYDLALFNGIEIVQEDQIQSYFPIKKKVSETSINILMKKSEMYSLWRKSKQNYIDLDQQFEKTLEERKPIVKKAEKILLEFEKKNKERTKFRSIISKLLLITDELLSDRSPSLNSEELIKAFKSIKTKTRETKGLFTKKMRNQLKSIKGKINYEFSEIEIDAASSLNDGLEELDQNPIKMILNLLPIKERPPPPPPEKMLCPTCEEECEVSKIRTFDCDHRICTDCAYRFLNEQYEKGDWSFDIRCFGECKKGYALRPPESYYFLVDILGQEKVDKMSQKLANDQADFRCANKECGFQCSLDPNQKVYFACPQCSAHTCLKCKELAHDGKVCTVLIEKMVKALGNSDENRLRVCPFCYEPYMKDQHCEHVKCAKCKNDWCFTCSVDRTPTMAHGVHFHRRDCKYFKPWIIDEKKNIENLEEEFDPQNCHRCKENNKPCERPISMKEFYKKIGFPLIEPEKKEEEQPEKNEEKID